MEDYPVLNKIELDKIAKEHGIANFDLSKQLKDLGYPQKGLWKWTKYSPPGTPEEKVIWEMEPVYNDQIMTVDVVAPTVAELGEMLPPSIEQHSPQLKITISCFTPKHKEINYTHSSSALFFGFSIPALNLITGLPTWSNPTIFPACT